MSVLCGRRDRDAQTQAFDDEKSKVRWPDSMHNVDPANPRCPEHPDRSMAFDIAEYHSDVPGHIAWNNKLEMWSNAVLILDVARDLKRRGLITHDLRWGGDWDGDGVPVFLDSDEEFWDAVHFELVKAA